MFFIPGQFIAIMTFPGVIVHEFAHMLFCRLRKVAVFDVCYIRFGNPFFINTLLCLLICLPAYMPIKFFDINHPFSIFLIWLGVSIGMHAIPSNQDASNVYEQAKDRAKHGNILAILSFPIVGLIYVFNVLRILWADLLYGVAIGIGIPSLVFG